MLTRKQPTQPWSVSMFPSFDLSMFTEEDGASINNENGKEF